MCENSKEHNWESNPQIQMRSSTNDSRALRVKRHCAAGRDIHRSWNREIHC